jgi:hypothetical protein
MVSPARITSNRMAIVVITETTATVPGALGKLDAADRRLVDCSWLGLASTHGIPLYLNNIIMICCTGINMRRER